MLQTLMETKNDMAMHSSNDENIGAELPIFDSVMELPLPCKTFNKLKDPYIKLERCDKIWKTLQLIRTMQEDNGNEDDTDSEETESNCEEVEENNDGGSKTETERLRPSTPYIPYKPDIGNGNTTLSNLTFEVTKRKQLFQCETCGKEYREKRSMREHSEKVHGIYVPLQYHKKVSVGSAQPTQPVQPAQPDPVAEEDDKRRCPTCGKIFTRRTNMIIHSETMHGIAIPHKKRYRKKPSEEEFVVLQPEPQSKDERRGHYCQICGKVFVERRSMKKHSLREHGIHIPPVRPGVRSDTMVSIPNNINIRSMVIKSTKKGELHLTKDGSQAKKYPQRGRGSLSTRLWERREFSGKSKILGNEKQTVWGNKRSNVGGKSFFCPTCGKGYAENRSMKVHSFRDHGIFIPKATPGKKAKEALQSTGASDTEASRVNASSEKKSEVPVRRSMRHMRSLPANFSESTRSESLEGTDARHSLLPENTNGQRSVLAESASGELSDFSENPWRSVPAEDKSGRRSVLAESTSGRRSVLGESTSGRRSVLAKSTSGRRSVLRKERKTISPDTSDDEGSENMDASSASHEETQHLGAKTPGARNPKILNPEEDIGMIICVLCQRQSKYIRNHLTMYHKIKTPGEMVRMSIERTLNKRKSQSKGARNAQKVSEPIEPIAREEQQKTDDVVTATRLRARANRTPVEQVPSRHNLRKRKADWSFANLDRSSESSDEPPRKLPKKGNSFVCDVCFGVYANPTSWYRHTNKHRMRGETKENSAMWKNKYKNSRIAQQRDATEDHSADAAIEDILQDTIDSVTEDAPVDETLRDSFAVNADSQDGDEEIGVIRVDSPNDNVDITIEDAPVEKPRVVVTSPNDRQMAPFELKKQEDIETKCVCGMVFHNAYAMFAHKINCTHGNNEDTENQCVSRTSSDRDSGIGISITIKKRNDSYEIVSKENGDEQVSKDSATSQALENLSGSNSPNVISDDSDDEEDDDDDYDDDTATEDESQVDKSLKYSVNHSFLKLELVEDEGDINIEEEEDEENCTRNDKGYREETKTTEAPNRDGNYEEVTDKVIEFVEVTMCQQMEQQQGQVEQDVLGDGALEEATFNGKDPLFQYTHKCRKCRKLFAGNQELLEHEKNHPNKVDEVCPCGTNFKSIGDFDAHLQQYHPICLTCGFCKMKFSGIIEYDEHRCHVTKGVLSKKPITTLKCPICEAPLNSMRKLDMHFEERHKNSALPYQCYKCTESFPSVEQRSLHSQEKHSSKETCSICGVTFITISTKAVHESYHLGRGYPCHVCKTSYSVPSYLTRHIKRVHSIGCDDMVTCDICDKAMKRKSYPKHMRNHDDFTDCELCKKTFYNTRALEKHIMTIHPHNYPRKVCPHCERSFPTIDQLSKHITALHTDYTLDNFLSQRTLPMLQRKLDAN